MGEPFERLVPEAINDFEKVAALAGAQFSASQIEVEVRQKPHECPKTLPIGRMAVYSFFLKGQALKVGRAGPKTAARYTYQHYNPNGAGSTLAKSILTNPTRIGVVGIETESIGDWIRTHTDRVNLLLPTACGLPLLSLLEAFLHVRWNPVFEGRSPGSEQSEEIP